MTLRKHPLRIGILYPGHSGEEELAGAFRSFLEEEAVEVLSMSCLGIGSGQEVGQVENEKVLRFALANDHPDADAIFIPDTALHTATLLPELETSGGKTVLTANQVTFWEAMGLAGSPTAPIDLGRLFDQAPASR